MVEAISLLITQEAFLLQDLKHRKLCLKKLRIVERVRQVARVVCVRKKKLENMEDRTGILCVAGSLTLNGLAAASLLILPKSNGSEYFVEPLHNLY